MKTSELTGTALDWAVAKCEPDDTLAIYFDEDTGEPLCHDDWEDNQEYKPHRQHNQHTTSLHQALHSGQRQHQRETCASS